MKETIQVEAHAVENFIRKCLLCEQVDEFVAESVTSGLVQTSLRGIDSHGIRLFPHYLRALKAGRINPKPKFEFFGTSPSTGILDGDHTYGHAAGKKAALLAVKLAHSAGTGHVAVRNSTHFGAAAYYALEIANHDMIGMSFTHADSLMLTYNSTDSFLGTNPICFAAPCIDEEPFCLDMATSLISFNEILQLRERKLSASPNAGADSNGNETTDSEKIVSLFPIGQYKGFGLSLMVEILCSLLSGMPYGKNITSMYKDPIHKKRRLGHFFLALRIDCFEDPNRFKVRMRQLMNDIRNQPIKNKDRPVMVAGDPEKITYRRRIIEGIPVKLSDWRSFLEIGNEYDIYLREK